MNMFPYKERLESRHCGINDNNVIIPIRLYFVRPDYFLSVFDALSPPV